MTLLIFLFVLVLVLILLVQSGVLDPKSKNHSTVQRAFKEVKEDFVKVEDSLVKGFDRGLQDSSKSDKHSSS